MSKDYAAQRARLIRLDAKPHTAGPGDPGAFAAERGRTPPDRACTTHLGVVDQDGMMVSLTNTIGDLWGSFVVARGSGVLLNDCMLYFDPVPGRINSIAPGKSPLSGMASVLVHRDGKPSISLGAPGGRKIMTGVLQSLVNVIDHGMSLQEAIAAPRLHCEKERLLADSRFPEESLRALEAMGHPVHRAEETFLSSSFSRPVGVLVDSEGRVHSGVDALRPATAIGVPASEVQIGGTQ